MILQDFAFHLASMSERTLGQARDAPSCLKMAQDGVKMPKMAQDRPKTIQAWPNTVQHGTKWKPHRSERTPGVAQDGVSVLGVVARRPQDGHKMTRDSLKMASQLARTRGRPPEQLFWRGSGT